MRSQKYIKTGLAILGLSGFGYAAYSSQKYHLDSFGAVRIGRAAITVANISWDYYTTFKWAQQINNDEQYMCEQYNQQISMVHTRSAEQLLKLCALNGGCYIKVGQHLATLDYLIPPEYVETLTVLHSSAPQTPLPELLDVVRSELGREPSEIISEMGPEPLGTASLAQVYKTKLKDGSTIALKIQHPRVRDNSWVDIHTMEILVKLVAWGFPDFQLLWLAEVTKKNLPIELDFVQEAKNAERVASMFCHLKWLKVPLIRWDLTTSRLLAMEYCEGGQVTDPDYLHSIGVSPNELSQKLGWLYSEMIFKQGYIHCDPHPGNLLVRKQGKDTEIVLLDHGLYMTLPDEVRWAYSRFWMGILTGDTVAIEREASKLGVSALYGLFACMVAGRSWKAITGGLQKHKLGKAEENQIKSEIKNFVPEISAILSKVPHELLLIFKTNDLLRGIEYKLGTKGNMTSFITMSEWCTRSVYGEMYGNTQSRFGKAVVLIREQWVLFKIKCFRMYLGMSHSPVAQYFRNLFDSLQGLVCKPAISTT